MIANIRSYMQCFLALFLVMETAVYLVFFKQWFNSMVMTSLRTIRQELDPRNVPVNIPDYGIPDSGSLPVDIPAYRIPDSRSLLVDIPAYRIPDSGSLLVDTPSCRIPDIDPFDKSVADLINPDQAIFCDEHLPSITYEHGNMLRINWTVVMKFYNGTLGKCQYWPLLRKNNSDSESTYGEVMSLTADTRINDEFIRVECINSSNVSFYKNFHTFISLNKETEVECDKNFNKHKLEDNPKEVLNVLLIGIDSVSRLNFIRQMPRTRKYLLEKMGAVEMTGHTKVADNIFPNVVPILSGKFPQELPWGADRHVKFDKYNWIWKDFMRNGYRTSYIEDAPKIDAFHYTKKGFANSPTHFYNRVFSIAMEKERDLWDKGKSCFRDRLEGEIVLKQTRDFITLHRNKPHFALTFITRLTHSHINRAGSVDELHFRNLRQIYEGGLLNNTMLIFFSDHGCRFGKFRQTFVGNIEGRLPLCLLAFPAWFRNKYPEITNNIKTNSRKLTSHFDLYETMQDVLLFDGKAKKANVSTRGISLLREIPRDRSCDQAGILPQWCVCLNTYTLDTSSGLVQKSALHLVNHINDMLRDYRDRCKRLTLISLHNPVQMEANRAVIDHKGKTNVSTVFVQLSVVTTPGLAVFEGTVRLNNSTDIHSIAGDISRLNMYGNQSHCIDDFHLKKFCFCEM